MDFTAGINFGIRMDYISQNPFTRQVVREFACQDQPDLSTLHHAFKAWRQSEVVDRAKYVNRLAKLLEDRLTTFAALITAEMGKPIAEAEAEITKCIVTSRYFASRAEEWLLPRVIDGEARYMASVPEPLGPVLAIMPWNFPFWQVVRFAIPNVLVGNTIILKHAPNVPRCATALEELFRDAGFPSGVFSNHYLSARGVERLIQSPTIAAVTFTGSDHTGEIIGELAGRALKKITMELGGNDPMLVFDDVDVDAAVLAAITSRCINSGQACNGAKRFLVHENIHDRFVQRLSAHVSSLPCGDPTNRDTRVGPLARRDFFDKLNEQVYRSVEGGAVIATRQDVVSEESWVYPPTVLTHVLPGQPAFEEELFGPVWAVTSFRSEAEAIRLANASSFGLGASVWTSDEERIRRLIVSLETGNVFVNDFVRSDPRLPFGGIKRSGHGKELGETGFFEFVNWKTVYWKE